MAHSDNEMVNLRSVIEILCYMVDDDSDGVEEVMQLPTIEVVECIECKYCSERGGHANCNGYLICTNFKRAVDEDSFCSWGERRE